MSFSRPLRLPQVSNVGANQTATIGMPVGSMTYEAVNLGLTDIAKDKIKNLEVRANGKPIQSYKDVGDLEAISGYYGNHIATTEVEIPFFRQHFTQAAQARMFNLGVSDLSTAEVSFDVADVTGSPAVKAYGTRYTHTNGNGQPDGNANRLGAITKIRHFTHAATGAGRLEISDLPKEMFLQALHLKSDKVTEVKLELNGQVVWELTFDEMVEYLKRHGRNPQTGWYHLDWMLTNELGNQLAIAGLYDFRLILEMSAADTITLYPEYWSGLGGI
ncbi:major capsid protein P2 [Kistimonas asteriae]|uniref:major capsid protein P2 n=1 Tax=Kistimonas asteriae TaxID=517724 RepID=UPI001BA89DB0|nr:major capsid protein P2 [Kistimonas asteriae]